MLPVTIVPENFRIILAGQGSCFEKRLKFLNESVGAGNFFIADNLPTNQQIDEHDIIYIAGIDSAKTMPIYNYALSKRKLINVEDVPNQCNFHVPARVRRGRLLLTVSTGGASPRISARIRRILERIFDESWESKLETMAEKRAAWKRQTKTMAEIAALTDNEILESNLFQNFCDRCKDS